MNYPWVADIILLFALCILFIIVIVMGNYWYRYYSTHAKSLDKRLDDIVNLRSQPEGLLDKAEMPLGHVKLARLGFATQLMDTVGLMILRAGVDITATRLLAISGAFFLGALLFLAVLTSLNFYMLILFGAGFAITPLLYIKRKEQKRRIQIEKQLPEALDFVCRSLRVGHSLTVSFGMVGDELPNPIAKEFRTVFEEVDFGLPFNEAMSNFGLRINSADVNFMVVGLLIQREAGGNLIGLLENLAKTVRDRTILAGKVKALSAEGKYSGILLSALPIFLGAILSALNPSYMNLLWTTQTGQHLVTFSIGMIIVGCIWMWKLTKLKV